MNPVVTDWEGAMRNAAIRILRAVPVILLCILLSAFPADAKRNAKEPDIDWVDVQTKVMGFSATYSTLVNQAWRALGQKSNSSVVRSKALGRGFLTGYSGIMIAASANPKTALLDMVVLASLEHAHADRHWNTEIFGEKNVLVLQRLRKGEEDIWELARQYLTPEEQTELRQIIDQWLNEHPDVQTVSFIRISDLDDMRAATQATTTSGRGVLGSVSQVAESVDATRLLAERQAFYFQVLPLLLGAEYNLLLERTFANPDVRHLIDQVDEFSETTKKIAALAETLPEQITAERAATMEDVSALIDSQRAATMADVTTLIDGQREAIFSEIDARHQQVAEITTSLQTLLERSNEVVTQSTELITQLDATLHTVERLAERFVPPHDTEDWERTDVTKLVNDSTVAIEALTTAARDLDTVVKSSHEFLQAPEWTGRLEDVDVLAGKQYRRALTLVAVFFAGVLGVFVGVQIARSRLGGKKD
jgi:hypothetical protein